MNERIKQLYTQVCMEQKIPFTVEHNSAVMLDAFANQFAELIVAEAFRAGMLYSAKKYAAVCEDRFTGNDVAMFLEMEACELSDEDIKEHFGVEE